MFHFPAFASSYLYIQNDDTVFTVGSPIQIPPDQWMFGSSPGLFAACHVFPRLSAPRHPPVALTYLFPLLLPYLIVNLYYPLKG